MKKFTYTWVVAVLLTCLVFNITSCSDSKANNEPTPEQVTKAAEADLSSSHRNTGRLQAGRNQAQQVTEEEVRNYESPIFIVKYDNMDWRVNKAEWEAWKADPSNEYEKFVALDKNLIEVELAGMGTEGYFEAASLADQIDKIIDMQMTGENTMPMKAVQLIEAKAKYLAYAKKGF